MKVSWFFRRNAGLALVVLIVVLVMMAPLTSLSMTSPSLGQVTATQVTLPMHASTIQIGPQSAKTADPRLELALVRLHAAHEYGDSETLVALAKQPHIDLETKSVRVIMEMG